MIRSQVGGWTLSGTGDSAGAAVLDTYPNAAAAYSLRKLRTAYSGSAIRVRESGGDTETDIGFDGNDLDEAALLAHCGANDGFVVTWYDQSGNGLDATQSTASSQPIIVNSGSVVTDNGKPAMDLASTRGFRTADASVCTQPSTSFAVGKARGAATFYIYDGISVRQIFGVNSSLWSIWASTWANGSGSVDSNTHIYDALFNGASSNMFVDGADQSVGDPGTNGLTGLDIGDVGVGSGWSDLMSELVIWDRDLGGDRAGARTNMNDYYSIY